MNIRDMARSAYVGWRGWCHQRHWPEGEIDAARKIREEALREAVAMREAAETLRRRARECDVLVDVIDDMLAHLDDDVSP